MVRVYFLIEAKQERIHCLLNPEGLIVRRQSGLQPRRSVTGQLTGAGLEDDPLLFTGGGRTVLDLDLLFDVALSGSTINTEDVRSLTRPLMQLAENSGQSQEGSRPPLVRFIWGKSWNIPGYVSAVAERLERFTADGIPQRSWLRLRFVRAADATHEDITVKKIPSLAGITLAPGSTSGGSSAGSVAVKTTTLSGGPAAPSNPLRPAPEEDLGLTPSVVLAADIIGFSLANTHAGRLIGAGLAWMGARLELAGKLVADWIKSAAGAAANFASTQAGKLAAFIGQAIAPIKAKIKEWLDPPPSAFMTKIKSGIGAVGSGIKSVLNRIKTATTPAAQALANLLRPVFEDIRDTLSGVMTATWLVAKSVKAKAAQVLSSACKRIGALSTKIGAAFQSAFKNSPELLKRVGAGVTAALGVIGGALAAVKLKGATADFHLIPDALAKIAGTVKDLVVGGARRAAQIVRKGIEAIAHALRNVFSAREASAAVSKKQTIRQVSDQHKKLNGTLQELKTNPDPAKIQEARSTFGELQGQVNFLKADPEQAARPVKPVGKQPAEPAGTQPVAPAGTQPTQPGGTQPVEPVGTQPAQPGGTQPVEPAGTQPAEPPTGEPAPGEIPALPPLPEQALTDLETAEPIFDQLEAGTASPDEVLAAITPPLEALNAALESTDQAEDSQSEAQFKAAASEDESAQPAPVIIRPRLGDRLDQVAYEQYGDPAFWRLLAAFNDISDIFHIPSGQPLSIPPETILEGR